MSAWRTANATHVAAYTASYLEKNAKAIQASKAAHRRKTQAAIADYNAAYYREHRDEILARYARRTPAYRHSARQRRAEWNRMYGQCYRREHPQIVRDAAQRHLARKRANFVEPVATAIVYERDGGICQICMKPVSRQQASLDHILPVSRGGEHSYRNVRLTHFVCNRRRQHRGAAQLRLLG